MQISRAHHPFSNLQEAKKVRLPGLVTYVIVSTILACVLARDISFLGFSFQGYVWVVALVMSLAVLTRSMKKVSFPWLIWLPWMALVVIYLVAASSPQALQRVAMLLCPILVGMAASTFPVDGARLQTFMRLTDRCALGLIISIIVSTGILFTGVLPAITGLAAQVMTACLLATVYVARYAFEGTRKWLYYWIGLVLLPVVAVTRTGVVAAGLTLPLTLAPLNIVKRVVILGIIAALGLSLFYTERFQTKMFYSGSGELSEMSIDNPDFRTTGRVAMWELMEEGVKDSPWFGKGADATDALLTEYAGFATHPHNDWLRLRYDYGYVGTFVFAVCIVLQVLHAWRRARKTIGETRILFYAGASSFIPFVMFMSTDNIILYCQFFGNLQFAILGLAYASVRTAKEAATRQAAAERRRRIAEAYMRQNVPAR